MTIESIVILLVVAAGTVAALALPIMQNRTGMYRGKQYLEQLNYDELLTEYERVLVMIRDLDEDHNMGKLDLEQYQYEREYWAKQGVMLLQKLEAKGMKRPTKNIPQATESDPEMDLAIEEAIAAYRKARTEASGAS